jgi:hypothetical protein
MDAVGGLGAEQTSSAVKISNLTLPLDLPALLSAQAGLTTFERGKHAADDGEMSIVGLIGCGLFFSGERRRRPDLFCAFHQPS